MQYWYNVNTGQVETSGDTERKDHLMGPYASAEEAQRALETSREKNEAADAADKAWDEANEA